MNEGIESDYLCMGLRAAYELTYIDQHTHIYRDGILAYYIGLEE